jgi:hypothetical protein
MSLFEVLSANEPELAKQRASVRDFLRADRAEFGWGQLSTHGWASGTRGSAPPSTVQSPPNCRYAVRGAAACRPSVRSTQQPPCPSSIPASVCSSVARSASFRRSSTLWPAWPARSNVHGPRIRLGANRIRGHRCKGRGRPSGRAGHHDRASAARSDRRHHSTPTVVGDHAGAELDSGLRHHRTPRASPRPHGPGGRRAVGPRYRQSGFNENS